MTERYSPNYSQQYGTICRYPEQVFLHREKASSADFTVLFSAQRSLQVFFVSFREKVAKRHRIHPVK